MLGTREAICQLVLYPLFCFVWAAVSAIALFFVLSMGQAEAPDLSADASLFLTGCGTIAFLLGGAAIAIAIERTTPDDPQRRRWTWNINDVLALVGLTCLAWVLPSWLTTTTAEWVQDDDYGWFVHELARAPLRESWPMHTAILFAAPVCEELIFRGFLWRRFDALVGNKGALVLTTALFAAFHVEPTQMAGVLPLGLLYGLVRWRTASVVPCIGAHFLNNVLATCFMFQPQTDAPAAVAPPLWLGLSTFVGAIALVMVLRRPEPTPTIPTTPKRNDST